MDETLIQTPALPWPPTEGQGSPVSRRPDARWARGVGAHVEADPDAGAAPRGLVSRRGRGRAWDLPARGSARRLAVSKPGRAGCPDRRSAAEAAEASRRAA